MAGHSYARTVTLDLDTESWDEILAFAESVKQQVAGFVGLLSWFLVVDRETGKGTSFSIFENRDAFLAVKDELNRILSVLGKFLSAPPTEILGHVLMSLDNQPLGVRDRRSAD